MRKVSGVDHLYVRDGTFYFRAAVPRGIQTPFGRKECKASLRTSDLKQAKRQCLGLAHSFHEKCDLLRNQTIARPRRRPTAQPSVDQSRDLARMWFDDYRHQEQQARRDNFADVVENWGASRVEATCRLGVLENALDQGEPPLNVSWLAESVSAAQEMEVTDSEKRVLEHFLLRAQLEDARRTIDRFKAKGSDRVHDTELFDRRAQPNADQSAEFVTPTLKRVIDQFMSDPGRSRTSSTRRKYWTELNLIANVFGPDTPIGNITRKQCREFRNDILIKLPTNASKKFPKLSHRDIAERFPAKEGFGLKPKTIKGYLDRLNSLLEFAVVEELIIKNHAKNLRAPKGDQEKGRQPFTGPELKRVFKSPIYTGCMDDERGYATTGGNNPRRGRYWVPLLALYNGLRLEEACQLHSADIRLEDNVSVLEITDKHIGADVNNARTLKSKASKRVIPIHPKLVELGLVSFARRQKRSNHVRLFPELRRSPKGNLSDPFSKWFGRFLDNVDVTERDKVFHSFRHTFRDALRDGEVSEEIAKFLGGWSRHEVQQKYGRGPSLKNLQNAISKVRYPSVQLALP